MTVELLCALSGHVDAPDVMRCARAVDYRVPRGKTWSSIEETSSFSEERRGRLVRKDVVV